MSVAFAADDVSIAAAPADKNDAPVQLDEVVVSGSRTSEKLSQTPMAIGKVNNEVLKRDKPKNIGEAINRIPGVAWVDLGNEQHMMSIRQPMSTNAVYQYLEDGIPIRPLGVFNHNALNEMNMAGSDSIEVVKGAASSLYGSNAVGGTVNFISAHSSPTPEVSAGFRNEAVTGFQRVDIGASNTWENLGLRFSEYSSRRTANNWQMYSRGSKDSATLRGDYALGNSLVHATLTYNNLDAAMSDSLSPSDYQTRPGYDYQTFTWRKDKATRLNLGWEGETMPNGLTSVTLFGRRNDHGQLPSYTIFACTVSATCPTGYHGTVNNNGVSSLGVDAKHQQDFNWLSSRLIAGLYLDSTSNTYKSDNLDVTRNPATNIYTGYVPSTAYTTGTRDYKTDIMNTALFAQWELSPLDKLRVVAGGRYDSISYKFANNLTPGAAFGAPNETRSFGHFSPKIGSTYAVSDRSSVYANISEGFTPPEVSQLYGISAIPNLKPATYDNYEIGTRIAFLDGALKLDSAVYRLDGRDTIVSYTIAPGNSVNQNAGRTRSHGLELGLNWTAGQFDARLGSSISSHRFLQYQTSAALDFSGKEMPQAPSNITTAEIGYKPAENIRIALEMVQQGAYWMNNANTVRYDGHRLFNVRGNYKFAAGWDAWLQGRNLTNQLYANNASSSYNGTGTYNPGTQDRYTVGTPRSLMVGVTCKFDGKK